MTDSEMKTLSDAQHALLCEVIAGRIITEESWAGERIRHETAKVSDAGPHCYYRPRYIRNNATVFALLENGLLREIVLWPDSPTPRKAYTYSEKAFAMAAAYAARRKNERLIDD